MKKIISLLIIIAISLLTGCAVATSQKLAADLTEFEKLGVSEIQVTGKFTSTDYVVTHVDGVRKAMITHTDPWLTSVKVVRETKE